MEASKVRGGYEKGSLRLSDQTLRTPAPPSSNRSGLENQRLNVGDQKTEGLLEERYDFVNIVARSEKMKRVLEMVSQIAERNQPFTSTGKAERERTCCQSHSPCEATGKNRPLSPSTALLSRSFDGERTFRHEKGAFTGAVRSTKGLFTQAHGGPFS